MNDIPEGYAYPSEVRFEINEKSLADYRLAADYLNMNHVDLVCLQHEFGIFGGDSGSHVLELLRNLRMPLISTFHTVLSAPKRCFQHRLLSRNPFWKRLPAFQTVSSS